MVPGHRMDVCLDTSLKRHLVGPRQKVVSLDSASGGLEVSVPRGTSSVLGKLELINAEDPSDATCCFPCVKQEFCGF